MAASKNPMDYAEASIEGPKRVVMALPEARGGICRHAAVLSAALVEESWSVTVAGPAGSLSRCKEFGAPTEVIWSAYSARFPGPIATFAAAIPLHAVAVQAPCIVHAHGYKAAISAALCRSRPFVVTAHNLLPSSGRDIIRLALRRADAVLAVSEAVADQISDSGVPGNKILVAPNGIDLGPVPTDSDRAIAHRLLDEILAARGVAPGALGSGPLILGIGRLSREKGFDVLIQAFARIAAGSPGARLVLVGDGPEADALRQAAPGPVRDRVVFAGQVPDARPLIPAADVVAIPSRVEGQSRVALEALAAGVRTLASNVGGLPGMVIPGKTGWLARVDDPDDLARSLGAALASAPEAFTEAGREWIRQRFEQKHCTQRVIRMYDTIRSRDLF